MSGHRFVLDCRWIGFSGVGRATTTLVGGLRAVTPGADWLLWGGPDPVPGAWPDAGRAPAHPPMRWAGQRDLLRVPPGSAVLFPHAVRPLIARRSTVVVVHDTIPLRWAASAAERRLWRAFLRRSARAAGAVVTASKATAQRVADDLAIPLPTIVRWPVDQARAERVRAARRDRPGGSARVLYLGQVKPHKNLVRAVEGFARSALARDGAVLTIVAGGAVDAHEGRRLDMAIDAARRGGVSVERLGLLRDAEVDDLLASATLLVQPSLEEGYGLPVVEALAAGVPVCCSDIDTLREVAAGQATLFDPLSVDSMAEAIDRTARKAAAGFRPELPGPSAAELGRTVLGCLEAVASDRRPQTGAGSRGT